MLNYLTASAFVYTLPNQEQMMEWMSFNRIFVDGKVLFYLFLP